MPSNPAKRSRRDEQQRHVYCLCASCCGYGPRPNFSLVGKPLREVKPVNKSTAFRHASKDAAGGVPHGTLHWPHKYLDPRDLAVAGMTMDSLWPPPTPDQWLRAHGDTAAEQQLHEAEHGALQDAEDEVVSPALSIALAWAPELELGQRACVIPCFQWSPGSCRAITAGRFC